VEYILKLRSALSPAQGVSRERPKKLHHSLTNTKEKEEKKCVSQFLYMIKS